MVYDMPPLILWALGAAGAAIVGRVLYRESQRVNAELHPEQKAREEAVHKLERDPTTGVYRPK
jgi:hypothetical protein